MKTFKRNLGFSPGLPSHFHLQGPAARVVGAGVVAHRVVVAHQAVARPQVRLPEGAAVAPPRPGRVRAQQLPRHDTLGVRQAAARAARAHLQQPGFQEHLGFQVRRPRVEPRVLLGLFLTLQGVVQGSSLATPALVCL